MFQVESMDGDDEIMDYLQSLLDHEIDCNLNGCPLCLTLQGVCRIVRKRIFEGGLLDTQIGASQESKPNKAGNLTANQGMSV
jgi:hypothetical protein